MRRVIVVVLPVPAPATMASGPRAATAASRCAGFKPSRIRSGPGVTGEMLPGAVTRPNRYDGSSDHVEVPATLPLRDGVRGQEPLPLPPAGLGVVLNDLLAEHLLGERAVAERG